MVIVMPENQWLGAPGDSLRSVLESFVPALPQAEPKFTLLQFSPDEMNDLLRQHRNILYITIGPDGSDNPGVKVSKDKWSSHQLVFTVNAPDENEFYNYVNQDFNRIAEVINQTERDRLVAKYAQHENEMIVSKLKHHFGIHLNLPDDCTIAKEEKDFIWLKRERTKYIGNTSHEITQGFFVFQYPYSKDDELRPEAIMARRDSMLKKYVPGPAKGTFMTTEYQYTPESTVVTKNERYTILTNGLWRMENYFMGGPFRSVTTLSDDNKYVISVSGFVFAPKFDKREYARELEAVLSSIRFDEG